MKEALEKYLEALIEKEFSLDDISVNLTKPPKKDMWDFAFGCFPLAKELKKSPSDAAQNLEKIISWDASADNLEKVVIDGPYINFFLSSDSYYEDLLDFLESPEFCEKQTETIVIDYIWANVGKPLHIGHMCTPTQGQTIINAYKRLWYRVISDSHIGDWGIIFWKLIRAYQEFWSEEKLHENAVEHLFELYVAITEVADNKPELEQEFRDTFKKLSEWDTELVELWKDFTSSSIEAMNIQLARLWVFTDYNIGESFYEWIGLPKIEDYPDLEYSMKDVVQELIDKGIATQNDDGSVGVEFPEETKIPSCILQKRDGTHGYLASDLATIVYRMQNWDPMRVIHFVDVRQQLHFRQTFYIAETAGWTVRKNESKTDFLHAHNGFITLKDWAMSTRKGKIIKLDLLLDEAEERAKKIIQEKRDDILWEELDDLAKMIGIGAVKYGYLKKTRESDVIFDWDEFMTFEWNSGPYIQYSYVRAKNILSDAGEIPSLWGERCTISSELKELILKLMEYKKYLEKTVKQAHPHILTWYCYDLAKLFNAFYNNENILAENNENYKLLKLMTLKKYTNILKDAMTILGIDMPEKM